MFKIHHEANYREKRRDAYPLVADQLDAIWKMAAALTAHIGPEAAAMLDSIREVKAKYPKT